MNKAILRMGIFTAMIYIDEPKKEIHIAKPCPLNINTLHESNCVQSFKGQDRWIFILRGRLTKDLWEYYVKD